MRSIRPMMAMLIRRGVTQAMAIGARKLGVRIIRRCRATDIQQLPGGEWQVTTETGNHHL